MQIENHASDESRARGQAHRQGLKLTKSRTRNTCAIDYGTYHLSDESNTIVAGERMTLDDVIAYLSGSEAPARLAG
jgi:hypothetical protein